LPGPIYATPLFSAMRLAPLGRGCESGSACPECHAEGALHSPTELYSWAGVRSMNRPRARARRAARRARGAETPARRSASVSPSASDARDRRSDRRPSRTRTPSSPYEPSARLSRQPARLSTDHADLVPQPYRRLPYSPTEPDAIGLLSSDRNRPAQRELARVLARHKLASTSCASARLRVRDPNRSTTATAQRRTGAQAGASARNGRLGTADLPHPSPA
jgi:hypothetical protein